MADNQQKFIRLWFLSEVLSSSSEDSDEDVMEAAAFLTKRKIPKVSDFIGEVIDNYTDEEFKQNLRISRATYALLVNKFVESNFYPKHENRGGKATTNAEKHILVFLWYVRRSLGIYKIYKVLAACNNYRMAGNKCVIREVSQLFNLSQSSVFIVLERVMKYFCSIAKQVIHFPTTQDELQNLATAFETVSGFPDVVGCVDGSYIRIRTPAGKIQNTYVNRHHQTSLILQGICDNNKRFIDVFTGISGKMHDSRVLSYSFIGRDLPRICGDDYHILGDAAYPLSPYLLTPYRDYGNLTAAQQQFNFKFSSTRVLIENTFGLLKARFRQLMHQTEFHTVLRTSRFIVSCCVLHNLCIDNEDLWDEVLREEHDEVIPLNQQRGILRHLGEQKRDRICDGFNNI